MLIAIDPLGVFALVALLVSLHVPELVIRMEERHHRRRSAALKAFRAAQREADQRRYVVEGLR
jgi:hypothetical protein